MIQITTTRFWIGITCGWPLFWMLVFNRWFFWSPFGLIIVFGIPIVGWALWFRFYRGSKQKIISDGRMVADMGVETLQKLKNRLAKK